MAQFHTPAIQPYNVFRPHGTQNLKSRYIPNNYYVEFTTSWWRQAIDNAINYSDLTWIDTLYSWCNESSPFLVSQINKRLVPISKTKFAITNADGTVDEELTAMLTRTKWWKKLIRARVLSKFYGVKVVGIDVVNDVLVDYPMRNIDMVNRAVRNMTYGIENVAYVKDYDNLFYMQPETDQDFKMGMLQPISRAMIGIVEAYNNWSVTGAAYSYPKMVVGYIDGNAECKNTAMDIADTINQPAAVAVVPFKQSLDDKQNVYQVEVSPIQTQMYPNAFEVFKEYIDSYRSEIMQLVTGGTLLGATEKNTNSEQLAQIHMGLYEDICDDDKRDVLNFFNEEGALIKLSRLLGIPELAEKSVVEVPDTSITVDKFERIGRVLSSMGLQYSDSAMVKVGMEGSDINHQVRNQNWTDVKLQKESMMAKIKSALNPKKMFGNGNGERLGEDAPKGKA